MVAGLVYMEGGFPPTKLVILQISKAIGRIEKHYGNRCHKVRMRNKHMVGIDLDPQYTPNTFLMHAHT